MRANNKLSVAGGVVPEHPLNGIMLSVLLCLWLLALPLPGQADPARPHITGLSHIALYVHDLDKSRAFYKNFLGFAEPYSLTNQDGSVRMTWIKINDRQSIELFPTPTNGTDRLCHIALETDDAAGLRDYLAARGVKVPAQVSRGKIGNWNYFIQDPDGRTVEIVQYTPDGWTMLNQGKFLPDTRISTHLPHVGILEGDLDAAKAFYEATLGFHELWRGGGNPAVLSWVHEQVPEGRDFIELMLYGKLPAPNQRGGAHHLCLEVPDLEKARAILESRAPQIDYVRPLTIKTGVNRKRQLNLFDPDGTRVELMESRTVDGLPAPSSTAPPPRHVPTQ